MNTVLNNVPNNINNTNNTNNESIINNKSNISHLTNNNDNSYSKQYVQKYLTNNSVSVPRPKSAKQKKNNINNSNKFQPLPSQKQDPDKFLSPKTSFNFTYIPLTPSKTTKNTNISKKQNETTTSYYNPNNTSCVYSSADNYWQRREYETQEKLNKIKNEQFQKEQSEIREKPMISKNSQKIANKIRSNSSQKVFDRLSSGIDTRKKVEELKSIEIKTNRNKPPSINSSSKKMKRTVDDLLQWKQNVERKKNETVQYLNTSLHSNVIPHINETSEIILRENKPDYFNKRVEDRLLEQGEKIRQKKEEQKLHYIENVMSKDYECPKSKRLYKNIESRYNKETNKNNFNKKTKAEPPKKNTKIKKKNLSFVNYYNHPNPINENEDIMNYSGVKIGNNNERNSGRGTSSYFKRSLIFENLSNINNTSNNTVLNTPHNKQNNFAQEKENNYLNDEYFNNQKTVPLPIPMEMPIRNEDIYSNNNISLQILNNYMTPNTSSNINYIQNNFERKKYNFRDPSEFVDYRKQNFNYIDPTILNTNKFETNIIQNDIRNDNRYNLNNYSTIQRNEQEDGYKKSDPNIYIPNTPKIKNYVNCDFNRKENNKNNNIENYNLGENILNVDYNSKSNSKQEIQQNPNFQFNNEMLMEIRRHLDDYYKMKKVQNVK